MNKIINSKTPLKSSIFKEKNMAQVKLLLLATYILLLLLTNIEMLKWHAFFLWKNICL